MNKPPKPEKKCACGREMTWIWADGVWLSAYNIWDGGSDFGRLSHVDCCKRCYDQENRRLNEEMWGY